MKKSIVGACLLAASISTSAVAAPINFDGYISDYNDVIITEFTVASDQIVSAWTDSFDSGTNFDPITALWESDGTFITQNDDNSSISPTTQTIFDSGFETFLTAGTYFFTISVFDNFADSSLNLFSGTSPFGTGTYGQTSGSGLYYSQWLDGVDSAEVLNPVPVPAAAWLFGSALLGFAGWARKKNKSV